MKNKLVALLTHFKHDQKSVVEALEEVFATEDGFYPNEFGFMLIEKIQATPIFEINAKLESMLAEDLRIAMDKIQELENLG